jgi:myo-inositol-1(or 4)-monophosphatase
VTELSPVLNEAVTAARRAGELIVKMSRERSYEVRQKHGSEIVTTADLLSDESIRAHLASCFPNHRFLSEEVAVEGACDFSGPVWIVDPIDGTANYGETFTAIRGQGAQCNGSPIRVSGVTELRRALIGTGFPHDRSDLSQAMARVQRLLTECQDIRRVGSPALDICWVAAGRLDAHCESLGPWDIAAAGLIATEAGAMRGNLLPGNPAVPVALRGDEFIVAAPGIFARLSELLHGDKRG